MSLFSSIQMARNALRADQIALQVVGQNIANANTPGYIREEAVLTPGPTQRWGRLLLGTGVQVDAIVQKIDLFLEERLRGAVSQRSSSETQEQMYVQLEGLINELGDNDLSTSLSAFFSSISEILNQPESLSIRNLAVLQGQTLAAEFARLAKRVTDLRVDVNRRVEDLADQINRLTDEIRLLNLRIAETEGASASESQAVGLRDRRLAALEELAGLVNIQVEEQTSGGVVVYTGGQYLVFEGIRREVTVSETADRGIAVSSIHVAETDMPLEATAGELHGLITARDEVLGGFLDRLDQFAGALALEFNKVFSSGQGLSGFQQLTSESFVDASDLPLNEAGLPFTPQNGSFQLIVHGKDTGLWRTTDILVDLNGLGHDMTLDDLAAALDAVDGISAAVTATGRLSITVDSADQEFYFANDTSAILAALGLNTFFTGSTASGLGVNQVVREDPGKFAAARVSDGPASAVDDPATANARLLADLLDQPAASTYGYPLWAAYDRMMAETTQGSAVARAVSDGNRAFEQTLRGEKLALSGVSIDEEAARLIGYQHAFQASARYIATLRELLELLVSL